MEVALKSVLLALTLNLTAGLMAAEAVYKCNGFTRIGKGRKLYDNRVQFSVPTPEHVAALPDAGTFRATEGAARATQDAVFELSDGSFFQLFKYPKPHPLGDHMVAAFRNREKKQALFQVIAFGTPFFSLNYNHNMTSDKDENEGGIDTVEHRIDCKLASYDSAKTTQEIPDDTRFSCEFDAGTENNIYGDYTSLFAQPLQIDWFPLELGRGSLNRADNITPISKVNFERRFKDQYQVQIQDWVQGSQLYSKFPDFIVDVGTGEKTGKRIEKIYMDVMTEASLKDDKRLSTRFDCSRLPNGTPKKKDGEKHDQDNELDYIL